MTRISTIVLLTICLTGCFTPSMKQYSQTADTKNNAVIITELKNADIVKVTKFDNNFNNEDRKEFKLTGISKIFSLPIGSYRQTVFVTEPGIYFISHAVHTSRNTTYKTALEGITPEGTIIYGAFEVKAGEVVYIGDLTFNWKQTRKGRIIDVNDNYNKVIRDLKSSSKYSDLAPKLKRTKFYPLGSKIRVDEAGNVTIENAY